MSNNPSIEEGLKLLKDSVSSENLINNFLFLFVFILIGILFYITYSYSKINNDNTNILKQYVNDKISILDNRVTELDGKKNEDESRTPRTPRTSAKDKMT